MTDRSLRSAFVWPCLVSWWCVTRLMGAMVSPALLLLVLPACLAGPASAGQQITDAQLENIHQASGLDLK